MAHAGGMRAYGARQFFLWLVLAGAALLALAGWSPPARAADPAQGPGGPILVLTAGKSNFGHFYAEILRTEGLNSFQVADVSTLSAGLLAAHDVVLLAKTALSDSQAALLSSWVANGGNLVAMAPDARLHSLLGLTPTGGTLTNAYLLVGGASVVGNGITQQTMQFHGTATRYAAVNGATPLAMLFSAAATATANPAVTLRRSGAGQAAAFAFDLATSIVQTRQGNPAWAAQERDGLPPIRSDDKFYGAAAADPRADWVDLTKV
uniref:hypothetical protein n=1 Tax=Azohydromonas aeria TaxID=2590212 RepID=UPI0018DF61FE